VTRKPYCLAAAGLTLILVLGGCARHEAAEPAVSVTSPALQWLGRWTGPEGTYLDLARTDEQFSVTIRNLDAARTFAAEPDASGFTFERDGVQETIRATDGPGTGMKWLADKANCLVVRPGEGFCRN
jgi:hypothetical protein